MLIPLFDDFYGAWFFSWFIMTDDCFFYSRISWSHYLSNKVIVQATLTLVHNASGARIGLIFCHKVVLVFPATSEKFILIITAAPGRYWNSRNALMSRAAECNLNYHPVILEYPKPHLHAK